MRRAGIAATLIAALATAVGSVQEPAEPGGLGLLDSSIAITAAPIEQKYLLDGQEPPVGLAQRFKVGGMPPVLTQGNTPRCVAFSISTVKNWQDRREFGRFFDFNERRFADLIGTTAAGAYMSVGLGRARDYGYPVVTTGNASRHRIASYWSIGKTAYAIKRAIYTYGPVLLLSPWYQSWNYPKSNGVLPAPNYIIGGHAYVAYGWDDDRGIRIRNSWGTAWGLSGDAFLPYRYLDRLYGGYATLDRIWKPAAAPTPKPTVTPKPEITPLPSEPLLTVAPPTAEPSAYPTLYPTESPAETVIEPHMTVEPDLTPDPPPADRNGLPIVIALCALIGLGVLFVTWRRDV